MNRLTSPASRLAWLALLLTMLQCLLCGAAWSKTYTLPSGTLPSGCSSSGSTVTCNSSLTLANNDKINVSGSNVTLVINGNFSASANNIGVNSSSPIASNFTIRAVNFTLGNNAVINANLIASGNISIGGNAKVSGSLTAAGNIALAQNATATGNITASGNISFAQNATITGNIDANGNISFAQNATVTGNVTAGGSISFGNNPTVNGNCWDSNRSQPVLVCNNGATGSFHHLQITNPGTGSSCTPLNLQLKACSDAACTTTYSGTVSGTLSPFGTTFSFSGSTTLSLSSLASGSYTLSASGLSPSPSSSSTCISNCSLTVTACASNFDCQESSISGYSAASSRLYTKLADTAFAFDIIALKADGSIENNYSSSSVNKAVTVELFDDSPSPGPASCSAYDSYDVIASATATFTGGGRTTSASFAIDPATDRQAYRKLRCRVSDTSGSSPVYGCSTDRFAVRPQAFTITSSDANNTGTSGTPRFRAGRDGFSLSAASGATGYDGTPLISALTGSPNAGVLSGSFSAADSSTGAASASNLTYSEVGQFSFAANQVSDSSFTAIDQGNDCTDDYSNTLVNGKYGCKIGNLAAGPFGRFYPDDFAVTIAAPLTCPSGLTCISNRFAYSRQPFSVTITARNAAGNTTLNFSSSAGYAKDVRLSSFTTATGNTHPSALSGQPSGLDGNGTPDYASITSSNFSNGMATLNNLQFAFTTPPGTPTDSYLAASENSDNVQTGSRPGITVAQGRLRLSSAYGNGRSRLDLPLNAQYWSGSAWLTHDRDSSSLNSNSVISNPSASIHSISLLNGNGNLSLNAPTGNNTSYRIVLHLGATGGLTQNCSSLSGGTPANLPWLRSRNGNCTNSFDEDPSATATFGIYSPETRKTIHIRERF